MGDDKNTTTTYAVKIDKEVKEELQGLLDGYKKETGTTAGDFIKTLLEVYKTNKIVSKVSSTDADIKELNTLTSRIYSIYSNLIERNNNNNNSLQVEFSEQLTQKDNIINNLKSKLQGMGEDKDTITAAFNNACADKEEIAKENNQLLDLNNSYKLNISKLQEEIDDLRELKGENNKLSNQLEEHKKLLAQQQRDNINLSNDVSSKEEIINKLNETIEELNNKHQEEIKREKEIIELLKDKKILEINQKHQLELQDLQEKHSKTTEEYQQKHMKTIEEYQIKYKLLLEELEESKKENKKVNKKTNASKK